MIARVLCIPAKRFDRPIVTFLTAEESVALIDAGPENRWEGRRDRAMLPLTNDAQAVLAAWLDERGGLPEDPLLPTRTGRRPTRDAVERRVATHAATAAQRCPSLAGKRVHPHALRHNCAMSLLQARVDSTVIALWLGHADTRLHPAVVPNHRLPRATCVVRAGPARPLLAPLLD